VNAFIQLLKPQVVAPDTEDSAALRS